MGWPFRSAQGRYQQFVDLTAIHVDHLKAPALIFEHVAFVGKALQDIERMPGRSRVIAVVLQRQAELASADMEPEMRKLPSSRSITLGSVPIS